MHYIGGETRFPFDVLEQSLYISGRLRPVRVIIADVEFLANLNESVGNEEILGRAIQSSARFFFLLYRSRVQEANRITALGGTVVHVPDIQDFPRLAAGMMDTLGNQS
jgi:hypothetical protein